MADPATVAGSLLSVPSPTRSGPPRWPVRPRPAPPLWLPPAAPPGVPRSAPRPAPLRAGDGPPADEGEFVCTVETLQRSGNPADPPVAAGLPPLYICLRVSPAAVGPWTGAAGFHRRREACRHPLSRAAWPGGRLSLRVCGEILLLRRHGHGLACRGLSRTGVSGVDIRLCDHSVVRATGNRGCGVAGLGHAPRRIAPRPSLPVHRCAMHGYPGSSVTTQHQGDSLRRLAPHAPQPRSLIHTPITGRS